MDIGREEAITNIYNTLDNILLDINSLLEEEEAYFMNLSERDQESENGERSANAVDKLEKAHKLLEQCSTNLYEAVK